MMSADFQSFTMFYNQPPHSEMHKTRRSWPWHVDENPPPKQKTKSIVAAGKFINGSNQKRLKKKKQP